MKKKTSKTNKSKRTRTRAESGAGNITQLKSGSYRARVRINGEDYAKTFKTYEEAQSYIKQCQERSIRLAMRAGTLQLAGVPTVEQVAWQYYNSPKMQGNRETTRQRVKSLIVKHIIPKLGNYLIDEVTEEQAAEIVKYYVDNVKAPKKFRDYFKAVFSYAQEQKYITDNPFNKTRIPKKDADASENNTVVQRNRVFNENEMEKLREAAEIIRPNGKTKYKYSYAIVLLMGTGLRSGELLALKPENIDLKAGKYGVINVTGAIKTIEDESENAEKRYIWKHGAPKTAAGVRRVPLSCQARKAVDYFLEQNKGNTYLIGKNKTEPADYAVVRRTYGNLCKLAGLDLTDKGGGLHTLRHTFATNCLGMKIDIKTISEILGHSSVQVTLNLYVHSSMERKRNCMKVVSENLSMT